MLSDEEQILNLIAWEWNLRETVDIVARHMLFGASRCLLNAGFEMDLCKTDGFSMPEEDRSMIMSVLTKTYT